MDSEKPPPYLLHSSLQNWKLQWLLEFRALDSSSLEQGHRDSHFKTLSHKINELKSMWVRKWTNEQIEAQRLNINMMHAIIILRKINQKKNILMHEQTRQLFISSTLISYFLTCNYINAQLHHSNSLLTCDHHFTQFTAISSISTALHWWTSTRCWPPTSHTTTQL